MLCKTSQIRSIFVFHDAVKFDAIQEIEPNMGGWVLFHENSVTWAHMWICASMVKRLVVSIWPFLCCFSNGHLRDKQQTIASCSPGRSSSFASVIYTIQTFNLHTLHRRPQPLICSFSHTYADTCSYANADAHMQLQQCKIDTYTAASTHKMRRKRVHAKCKCTHT